MSTFTTVRNEIQTLFAENQILPHYHSQKW